LSGSAALGVTATGPGTSATGSPPATKAKDCSSFITLRVYEGIPLTQIAREAGTSVRMIEEHYAGVIANWDGKQIPAEDQIRAARKRHGRGMDVPPSTPPGHQ
jgi:hypothetical protein